MLTQNEAQSWLEGRRYCVRASLCEVIHRVFDHLQEVKAAVILAGTQLSLLASQLTLEVVILSFCELDALLCVLFVTLRVEHHGLERQRQVKTQELLRIREMQHDCLVDKAAPRIQPMLLIESHVVLCEPPLDPTRQTRGLDVRKCRR